MKILIVGAGGREHALAWRLAKDGSSNELFVSPGNPGIAQLARCFPSPPQVSGYADLARDLKVDFTVVGPEAPLIAGIVDEFHRRELPIVGPTSGAAQLEGSKIFAKQFFARAGIPTARSVQTKSSGEALDALAGFTFPVVIKADGLAAGKGVVIATTKTEAEEAIGKLGPLLVIEEFLEGEEVSYIGLSNGEVIVPLAPTQDHKRAFDGDKGPNTGGMGAYCDKRILNLSQDGDIMERVMLPAIRQMGKEGNPFTGILYAGLMMTENGPYVLEFNVRSGDPETQVLMHSYRGDLAELLLASTDPSRRMPEPEWETPSVCVVMSARGYPGKPETGQVITGIDEAASAGATVFHAGTAVKHGELVTSGGRVLGVTARGADLGSAVQAAYRGVAKIHFEGMHYRKDIGEKGMRRW